MKKNIQPRFPRLLAHLLFALGAIPFALGNAQASGTEPPSQRRQEIRLPDNEKPSTEKQEFVRNEMVKTFNEVQTLLTNKQYPEAQEKIKILNAFDKKTNYEQFQINRLVAIVASATNNIDELATVFDAMIKSGYLSKAEVLRFTEGAAGSYFNEKRYDKAKEWTKRYLALDADNAQMQNLLARIFYLQDDFPGTITEVNRQIQADDAANRAPSYDKLHLLISSYLKMKDMVGYVSVLERMVTHYPKKEFWADLIYRLPNKPGFSDRLRIDYYRLLLATDTLEEGPQYAEFADLALLAGLPTEAKKVVDAGYAANMLGTGKDAAKHKILRDKVNKQAADDLKSLDAGEASAKAAKNGIGLVNTGYNFVINGQIERGIALMEQGIARGGLKSVDEAKLHLGMAYLQGGNRAKATEIFKSLQGTDGAVDIGRYWLLVRKE